MTSRPMALEVTLRTVLLFLLWLIISEAAPAALIVGVPVVALTALASLWLAPDPLPRMRILPLARFLPFFLKQSLVGGYDVMRRAYHPALPLAPAILSYDIGRMGGAERVAFAILVNLVPGTLSARLEGDRLVLHALDAGMPVRDNLARLEARLAPIFRDAAKPAQGHSG